MHSAIDSLRNHSASMAFESLEQGQGESRAAVPEGYNSPLDANDHRLRQPERTLEVIRQTKITI